MKIGYFVTLFPYPESFQDGVFCGSYPIGGAEIAAYDLARSMVDLGHEVVVFATSVDSETTFNVSNGTKVCHFSKSFGIEKAFFSFQDRTDGLPAKGGDAGQGRDEDVFFPDPLPDIGLQLRRDARIFQERFHTTVGFRVPFLRTEVELPRASNVADNAGRFHMGT